MRVTVSTVKEPVEVLEQFVARNLASGVDLMFLMLDQPDAAVERFAQAHPCVEHVVCDDTWWVDGRPDDLNTRQLRNANLVKALLSAFDWSRWIFHLDADEVLCVAGDELDALPASVEAIQLVPLEAVARPHWEGPPTLFKRRLAEDDLHLLATLGAIPRPANGALFRGHLKGKSGVRVDSDLRLGIHTPWDVDGVVEGYQSPRMRHLHYDSPSRDEFVRKWHKMQAAGTMGLRQDRASAAGALRALLDADLDDAVRKKYLGLLFDQIRRDPEEVLAELGFLEEHRPELGGHQPRILTPRQRTDLLRLLSALHARPKESFSPKGPGGAKVLRRAMVEAGINPGARGPIESA